MANEGCERGVTSAHQYAAQSSRFFDR